MTWPELILAAGGVVFAIALVPTLFSPGKPYPLTSIVTALMLVGFTAAYVELGLLWPAATSAATAVLWGTLFYQAMRRGVEGTS